MGTGHSSQCTGPETALRQHVDSAIIEAKELLRGLYGAAESQSAADAGRTAAYALQRHAAASIGRIALLHQDVSALKAPDPLLQFLHTE